MSYKIVVLSRSWADGVAEVKVGTVNPRHVFGVGIIQGNDSESGEMFEVLLRRAKHLAGRKARRVIALEHSSDKPAV